MLKKYHNKTQKRLGLVLLGLISFSLFSCNNKIKEKEDKNIQPMQTIINANIIRSVDAEVEIELKSDIIHNFDGDSARMVFPKGVRAWFYDDMQKVNTYLEADYAINYQNSNQVLLRDSIMIIDYVKKDTIYCQELIWEKSLKRVYSNKPVMRIGVNGIAYGDGFESNERMDSLRIKNPRGTQYIYEE